MKESLSYLFLSGLILGSGPCVGFCAPILTGFIAAYKQSLGKALISYLYFSAGKLASYIVLGALCGMFSEILKSNLFFSYLNIVNIILGFFVLIIGVLTIIAQEPLNNKYCAFFAKGNLSNVSILGLLAGLSPCLPLLGILNYIVIIARSPFEGMFYALIFGLGTSISPVILLVGLSGKLAGSLSANHRIKAVIKIISSVVLIYLGARIILQKFIG